MPRGVSPPRSNKAQPATSGGWLKHDNALKGPWSFRTKEKIQCLCEGGSRCSKESPDAQAGGNAIPGLHSNWVGDDACMLAMARPWQENLVKYRLVDAFLHHRIGMVLNLQEVGEHDHCGPGNLPRSGFSYDPESFMAAKIGFYNFSWQDMGVPDLERMMDIVQVMDYVVAFEKRRVAVHCHAGLGRTGLAIACYILYQHRTKGDCCSKQVIQQVRKGRPGALQTRTQELFVSIFQQYLLHLSCLFGGVEGAPKGLQSLHSSPNLAATPTEPPTPPPPPQQQKSSSSLSLSNWWSNRRSPAKSALVSTQRQQLEHQQAAAAAAAAAAAGPQFGRHSLGVVPASSVVTADGQLSGLVTPPSTSLPSSHASSMSQLTHFPKSVRPTTSDASTTATTTTAPTGSATSVSFSYTSLNPKQQQQQLQQGLPTPSKAPLPLSADSSSSGVRVGEASNSSSSSVALPSSSQPRDGSVQSMQSVHSMQSSQGAGGRRQAQGPSAPPWDEKGNILLNKYSVAWVPKPPRTYIEALQRQQRLLHGDHRRSYFHLHRFVKKATFAIIAAAQEARGDATTNPTTTHHPPPSPPTFIPLESPHITATSRPTPTLPTDRPTQQILKDQPPPTPTTKAPKLSPICIPSGPPPPSALIRRGAATTRTTNPSVSAPAAEQPLGPAAEQPTKYEGEFACAPPPSAPLPLALQQQPQPQSQPQQSHLPLVRQRSQEMLQQQLQLARQRSSELLQQQPQQQQPQQQRLLPSLQQPQSQPLPQRPAVSNTLQQQRSAELPRQRSTELLQQQPQQHQRQRSTELQHLPGLSAQPSSRALGETRHKRTSSSPHQLLSPTDALQPQRSAEAHSAIPPSLTLNPEQAPHPTHPLPDTVPSTQPPPPPPPPPQPPQPPPPSQHRPTTLVSPHQHPQQHAHAPPHPPTPPPPGLLSRRPRHLHPTPTLQVPHPTHEPPSTSTLSATPPTQPAIPPSNQPHTDTRPPAHTAGPLTNGAAPPPPQQPQPLEASTPTQRPTTAPPSPSTLPNQNTHTHTHKIPAAPSTEAPTTPTTATNNSHSTLSTPHTPQGRPATAAALSQTSSTANTRIISSSGSSGSNAMPTTNGITTAPAGPAGMTTHTHTTTGPPPASPHPPSGKAPPSALIRRSNTAAAAAAAAAAASAAGGASATAAASAFNPAAPAPSSTGGSANTAPATMFVPAGTTQHSAAPAPSSTGGSANTAPATMFVPAGATQQQYAATQSATAPIELVPPVEGSSSVSHTAAGQESHLQQQSKPSKHECDHDQDHYQQQQQQQQEGPGPVAEGVQGGGVGSDSDSDGDQDVGQACVSQTGALPVGASSVLTRLRRACLGAWWDVGPPPHVHDAHRARGRRAGSQHAPVAYTGPGSQAGGEALQGSCMAHPCLMSTQHMGLHQLCQAGKALQGSCKAHPCLMSTQHMSRHQPSQAKGAKGPVAESTEGPPTILHEGEPGQISEPPSPLLRSQQCQHQHQQNSQLPPQLQQPPQQQSSLLPPHTQQQPQQQSSLLPPHLQQQQQGSLLPPHTQQQQPQQQSSLLPPHLQQQQQQQQQEGQQPQRAPRTQPLAYTATSSSAPQQPDLATSTLQPCHTFVHAVALCASRTRLEQQGIDVVGSLAMSPGYCARFVGGGVGDMEEQGFRALRARLHHQLLAAERRANHEDFEPLLRAPLMLIMVALEDFFGQFHAVGPVLSQATVNLAIQHYKTFPYEKEDATEAEHLRAASEVIVHLPVRDQELLLLFVALMRHCEVAAGDGTEEGLEEEEVVESHLLTIGRWSLHLLMGQQLDKDVEVPLLSLTWYFLRNDVAYGCLVSAKKKRIDKLLHSGVELAHPHQHPALIKYHQGQRLARFQPPARQQAAPQGHLSQRADPQRPDQPSSSSSFLPPISTDETAQASRMPAATAAAPSPRPMPPTTIHDAWI